VRFDGRNWWHWGFPTLTASYHTTVSLYTTQASPSRLWVTTDGRAHTFGIEAVVASRELSANTTTQIGLTAPEPACSTMRLSGGGTESTARLDVRAVGGR
jgi:hypothetical protein